MVFFFLFVCFVFSTDDWLWRRFDAWCSVCLWLHTMRRPLKSPFDGWSDDALGVRATDWPANSLVDWLAGLLIPLTDEWSCHHLGLAFPAILKADCVVFGRKFQSERSSSTDFFVFKEKQRVASAGKRSIVLLNRTHSNIYSLLIQLWKSYIFLPQSLNFFSKTTQCPFNLLLFICLFIRESIIDPFIRPSKDFTIHPSIHLSAVLLPPCIHPSVLTHFYLSFSVCSQFSHVCFCLFACSGSQSQMKPALQCTTIHSMIPAFM